MIKSELISAIAAEAGIDAKSAGKALNAFTAVVAKSLKAGDKVQIPGFGTFSVSERAARKGINPQTKKVIEIPAKKSAKFKAGSGLKVD